MNHNAETLQPTETTTPSHEGLGLVYRLLLKIVGEEWSEPGEDLVPHYEQLFSRAQSTIHMACDELNPLVTEHPDILRTLSQKLEDGREIEFLFDKPGASSPHEAAQAVEDENPSLATLARRYPQRLRLLWLPTPPKLEFSVVDSAHSLLEVRDPSLSGAPPTLIRYQDRKWASYLESVFEEARPKATRTILENGSSSPI
ncbi:MAG: hypothetical protein AAB414_00985 [Patescibacteria group bacterium]